ncbi:hypothetical protein QLH32_10375 [Acinetobacter corruptisaponis]|uniref:Uncharacterized protein n=1 Tax=Acinetobacter corruptisaponis TaxID=3045147 RepID=A0ABY8S0T9_9GAMM|nr:hypothetical protein [Acinetobacter sp. KCTC 92772]WHP04474.1 hypothetical protein QLH32_10375 [Acinetobacter sp. KCTC 92772]
MDSDNLRNIIQNSFNQAVQYCDASELEKLDCEDRLRNANRSRVWIETLAKSLLKASQLEISIEKYQAFYRKNRKNDHQVDNNAQMFGLTEFLFDIVIAEMVEFDTASKKRNIKSKYTKLQVIRKAVWIIECEFQRKDSRALLLDMNKLVLGRAEHKLFIMSQDESETQDWAIETFNVLSKDDDAKIFLARIPHPCDWGKQHNKVEVFEIPYIKEKNTNKVDQSTKILPQVI